MESKELITMRIMAWHRAKGELEGVLNSYWDNINYDKMGKLVKEFISMVENKGLVD